MTATGVLPEETTPMAEATSEEVPPLDKSPGMLWVEFRGYTDPTIVAFQKGHPVTTSGKPRIGLQPQTFLLQHGFVYAPDGSHIPWVDVPSVVKKAFADGARTHPVPGVHAASAKIYHCPMPGSEKGVPGCAYRTQSRDNYHTHCHRAHALSPQKLAQYEALQRGEIPTIGVPAKRPVNLAEFADPNWVQRMMDGDSDIDRE